MANSPGWQERWTKVSGRDYLVIRARMKRGEESRWECEAWAPASLGGGNLRLDGNWYVRPLEETAKKAIWYAFPDARGEWTGEKLVEPKGAPHMLGPPLDR